MRRAAPGLLLAALAYACAAPSPPPAANTATSDREAAGASEAARDTGGTARATAAAGVADATLPVCDARASAREGQPLRVDLGALCPGLDARWFPDGGPRGLRWDLREGTGQWTPAFIDGGRSYHVPLDGRGADGARVATGSLRIDVADTIDPPAPRVVETVDRPQGRRHHVTLVTDAFLDGPSRAGRTVHAWVTEPYDVAERESVPVAVLLHGFDGDPVVEAAADAIQISLHDPDNTYWWGYADGPGPSLDYTARQVEHLLGWVLRRYPTADPDRVWVHGTSMGGAGALVFAATRPAHVAWVSSFIGQTVPRNHRPRRAAQLEALWGAPAALPPGAPTTDAAALAAATDPWDRQDWTAALRRDPVAREAFVFLRHGLDDRIIHFGAVVQPSPLTGESAYDAASATRTAHYAVWDESGHGTPDPLLPSRWWHAGWHPVLDDTTFVALDVAHPAFSNASHDSDSGGVQGNGLVAWDDNSGFAGDDDVLGDTGWAADRAGAINRGLRWDSRAIVDEVDRFSVPIRVLDDRATAAELPLAPSEPCLFDALCLEGPVHVDVTPRRTQRFRLAPGEQVRWRFGNQSGEAVAAEDGSVTVPRLAIGTEWESLELERVWGR